MRTRMTLAEIGALMDNFEEQCNWDQEELIKNSPDCTEIIELFDENKEHDWPLTSQKLSVLGILITNVCKDINEGKVDSDFVSDRVETVLNSMLLPPEVWHRINIELGEDPGIFPDNEVKKMFEKKFGAITWDRMINGEVVKPKGKFGENWTDD